MQTSCAFKLVVCVIKRMLKNFKMTDDNRGATITSTLLSMVGEKAESIEATSTCLDYVNTWATKTDCGGLIHVSIDCFRFFLCCVRYN